jgi:hypothetical protein
MKNAETLATLGTKDTNKHTNTTQKPKKMSNTDPSTNRQESISIFKMINDA